MCALLSGLYIGGDHEGGAWGGGLAKEGKKCVFKGTRYLLPIDFCNIRTQKMSKFKMCKKW